MPRSEKNNDDAEPDLTALSDRQRELLHSWIPQLQVEEDMSWGLMDTSVLKVTTPQGSAVVKAGGPENHHIGREIQAHRLWTDPWVSEGRASRLLHADVEANILVTTFLPGALVKGHAAASSMDTYVQAGELLREFHGQHTELDENYEARKNARSMAWLTSEHRIERDTTDRLISMVRSWPELPAQVVPTHGDWQCRNWLIDEDGTIRVIDFGRTLLRQASEDLERLAAQEFQWHPGSEEAFISGYGSDPREPETWFRQRVRAAVGTAVWAFQVGDEGFEAQGLRMIEEALTTDDWR